MGCSGRRSRSSSGSIVIPHACAKLRSLGRSVTGSNHCLLRRSQRALGKLALSAATSSSSYGVFRASLVPCSVIVFMFY